MASLIPMASWQVSAAEFASAAPAATVAPGQTSVPVLDFTLPVYANPDRVLDSDGLATTSTGSISIQPGAQLFSISAEKKLYYGSGASYEELWIDRDMSKKYTYFLGNEVTFAESDGEVYWGEGNSFDPDVGAPVMPVGVGLKVVSRLSTLDWSTSNSALFSDNGTVNGLVDPADTRLDATGGGGSNNIMQRNSTFSQDAIVAWTGGIGCPTGVAIGDSLRVGNDGFFFVANMEYLQTAGGNCYASFSQANSSYPYPLNTAVTVLTPYNGAIAITKLTSIPNQNSTQLTVAEGGGNLKGIAAGDEISFKDAANNTIRFRVEKINSAGTGSLTVTYLAGSVATSDNLTLTVTPGVLNAITTATFFDATVWQPVRLKYIDENGNGTWASPEPLYWSKITDAKPNEVSHLDIRVNGVIGEQLLFQSGTSPSIFGETPPPNGTAVITSAMAGTKIYSQTADWVAGDDLVADTDNDGFYNRDALTSIQVLNEGTAPRSAISKVKLYHNGILVTELSDENIPGLWEAKNLSESLVSSGAFTIKADLTASAPNAGTLKFAIVKEGIKTTHRTLPNDRVRNAAVQTVSTGVAVIPEAPPAEPPQPVVTPELRGGDIFMVAGAAAGATLYTFENGKKNPFPNASIFLSWFPDFNSVTIKRIPETDVGALPWGSNMRYRPGTRMIKVPDDPKVYAVTLNGKVCWVKDEDIAKKFYGTNWNKKINDLPASLFVGRTNYQHDPACDLTLDSKYPTATLLRFQQKRYYVDNGTVREITNDGWTRNRFRDEFVIDVTDLTGYEIGADVTSFTGA